MMTAGTSALPVGTGGVGGMMLPVAGTAAGTAGTGMVVPPPPAGVGGAAGMLPPATGGVGGAAGMDMIPVEMEPGLALDECGLNTRWNGDELCILPPPPDKGFQVHIGPSNYDNPEPQYVLEPGQEVTENWPAMSGNTSNILYYWRQYRMRPGSHHMIVTAGGGFGGRRLGGSQNPAKDNPDRGVIAPENMGVGMELAARSSLNVSLHYLNYTEQPIIKEVWVNFWYRDAADVTEPSLEVFSMSPMSLQPGQHVIIEGTCPMTSAGRILTLYGHVHANNQRFSAWRVRGQQRDLLMESFDWEHPLVVEYSSVVTNTPSNPATKTAGGFNGPVDIQVGDQIYFECDIINNTSSVFRGANEAKDDEMCILVGDSVGAKVPTLCQYQTVLQ
jgi:hypothetical protein